MYICLYVCIYYVCIYISIYIYIVCVHARARAHMYVHEQSLLHMSIIVMMNFSINFPIYISLDKYLHYPYFIAILPTNHFPMLCDGKNTSQLLELWPFHWKLGLLLQSPPYPCFAQITVFVPHCVQPQCLVKFLLSCMSTCR